MSRFEVIDIPGGEPLATLNGDVVVLYRQPGNVWRVAQERDLEFLLGGVFHTDIEVRRATLLSEEGVQ